MRVALAQSCPLCRSMPEPQPLIEIDRVSFGYDAVAHDPERRVAALRARQGHGHPRRLGLRQDHAAAADRRGLPGHARAGGLRRRARRRRQPRAAVPAAPAPGHAVPVRRAVHRPDGVRQRRLPAARAQQAAGKHDPRHRADEAQRGGPARCGAVAHRAGLGRHGAAHRAGPGHGAGPGADHVRRALRRAGPDLDGRGRQPDPQAQRHHRRHLADRLARRAGVLLDLRLRLPAVLAGPGGGARPARRAARLDPPRGAAVHRRRARRPGALSLSGAAAGRRPGRRRA